MAYGQTDDYGYYATEQRVHMHDLHATIAHQLGLQHEKWTYRYAGRDFQLTDVYSSVVTDTLSWKRKLTGQLATLFGVVTGGVVTSGVVTSGVVTSGVVTSGVVTSGVVT